MTANQSTKAARLRAYRAKVKLRQRQAVTAAAVKRSELARRLRAHGLTWREVAQKMGVNSQFTARTIAMRNPKR
jgi:transcriptional regulator with XRE-family HTH domain